MSSDYLTSVHSSEFARLHGMRAVPHPPAVDKAPGVGRNERAANGQNLPPHVAQEARDEKLVESVVSRISDFVQSFQRDLHFTVDKDSGRTVIKVIDSQTEELIRQIPAEETLRIARNLDTLESLILREQA
jgi:flagellar protein FlaG